jgi:hypothetical protein
MLDRRQLLQVLAVINSCFGFDRVVPFATRMTDGQLADFCRTQFALLGDEDQRHVLAMTADIAREEAAA